MVEQYNNSISNKNSNNKQISSFNDEVEQFLENFSILDSQSFHSENSVHEFPCSEPVMVDHVLPLVLTDGAVLVTHPVSPRLHPLQDVQVGRGVVPGVGAASPHLRRLQVQQVQHQVGQWAELLRVLR